eukprot:jgi/Mesvir1/17483/Mv25040-RA.5
MAHRRRRTIPANFSQQLMAARRPMLSPGGRGSRPTLKLALLQLQLAIATVLMASFIPISLCSNLQYASSIGASTSNEGIRGLTGSTESSSFEAVDGAYTSSTTSENNQPQLRRHLLQTTDDRAALLAMKSGFLDHAAIANWTSGGDPCTFAYVTCSASRVTSVLLNKAPTLSGTLAPEVGNLTALTILNVGFTQVSGFIPPELGSLRLLTSLTLSGSKVSGTIPFELGSMISMASLGLGAIQQLSGVIPPELGSLSALNALGVFQLPKLSGTIPMELGGLTNCATVLVSGNPLLSGCLPPQLGGLLSVTALRVDGCVRLSCTIPDEFSGLTKLRFLSLQNTNISGSIPSWMTVMPSLASITLATTKLAGTIPPALGSLRPLVSLNLGSTDVSGFIPPELGSLSLLTSLQLYSMKLSGTIPTALGSLTSMVDLELDWTSLSGSIPVELGLLPSLKTLWLFVTKLSGTMPPLGSLKSLVSLHVGYTKVSGFIPPELATLTSLTTIVLDSMKLSGTIPDTLGNLPSLVSLLVQSNSLVGSIPSNGRFLTMPTLAVSGNPLICGPDPPGRTLGRTGTYNNTCPRCFSGAVAPLTPNWNCDPSTPFCVGNVTCLATMPQCMSDADCSDRLFCNGEEKCLSYICVAGTPPDCGDGVACTTDSCDEDHDTCVHVAKDAPCSDGLFCNGVETCDAAKGCVAGTAVDCRDGVACTTDSCDEDHDTCVHVAEDAPCSDGLFCNGEETCDAAKGCVPGTPVDCGDGVACTTDSCDEDQNTCVHVAKDAPCSDGLFCNGEETCDAAKGCVAGTPVDCGDGVACTTDSCDEDQNTCVHVANDAPCSDGLFCNGEETCDAAKGCVAGTPPDCGDGVACTTDSCDEDQNTCVHVAKDAPCSDGLFCNGEETCDAAKGCVAGTPPDCGDGVACTTDSCDEDQNTCVHVVEDAPCSDGLFCNGEETCDAAKGCVAGTPPDCGDGVACTTDSCDEDQNTCVHVVEDAPCSDGLFCNGEETCDAAKGCVAGTPVDCGDGVACTTDSCDEDHDTCVHVAKDAPCSDGLFCNGEETCDAAKGCVAGTPPDCGDGVACTTDSCDEDQNRCVHVAEDAPCSDGLFCNGEETCDAAKGCVAGTPPDCGDGVACTTDSCDEDQNTCVHVVEDAPCSDGLFCNGEETCDAAKGCVAGTPPDCGDGVACTTDSCDEDQNTCVHVAKDAPCSDGLFCNGEETCDAAKGCVAGTPPDCGDGVACTTDSCDEDHDTCVHVVEDAPCSDGLFCNGEETCDAAKGCVAGTPVDCGDGVACTTDSCDEDQNRCVHVAEDAPCSDGLFCNGVETCDAAKGCVAGTPPDCGDGVACTTDSCDEDQDTCVHVEEDAPCSDGLFCNGAETCDAAKGCVAGISVTCDDGIPCTLDLCYEEYGGCISTDIPCACHAQSDCGPGKCCCGNSCKPNPANVDCDFFCANEDCKGKGWTGVTCACIKDCQGPWCSSAGGNPCQQHGVCCCAGGTRKTSGPSGGTFQDKCKSCDQDCNGSSKCTGNYVPGVLSNTCTQKA